MSLVLNKIGEYFYPKEASLQVEGENQIIVSIGEYDCLYDYMLMEEPAKIMEEKKYIQAAVDDLENNLPYYIDGRRIMHISNNALT